MNDVTNETLGNSGIQVVEGIPEARQKAALPPKKILILGTCPSRLLAPLGDLSWDVFTIGPGGKNANRWNSLFEIHGNGTWPEGFAEYLHELKQEKPPKRIFTEEPIPDWPANVVFPKDYLFQKYGRMWFTSSISYAIAIALEENCTDLGIYGIDLESGEEYESQFVAARYFIDLARLAGVNLQLPKGCGLLRDPLPYPNAYESNIAMTLESKIEYLNNMAAQKRAQHGQLAAEINHIDGEIAFANFMRERYVVKGVSADERVKYTQKPSLEAKVDMLIGMLGKHPGEALKKLI
jgi:hypothetical protein